MTAAHSHLVDVADRIRHIAVSLGEALDAVHSTAPRDLAAAARRDQALLAIIRGRQTLFPGFQFGADGRPLPVIRTLRRLAEEMGWPESGVVQWLCARTTYLDELRPVDLVADDPERVVDAALALGEILAPPPSPLDDRRVAILDQRLAEFIDARIREGQLNRGYSGGELRSALRYPPVG
ncbi:MULTISPECIES: hypothetical protein [Mycolicibacterium]|uniref:hypothetical protein n=1 Tax=Mycolicibacterium monacense TaxID=85693 RepID=UPI0007EA7382|nr:hypothetical protein [Mycolicibacterium monacense]OBB61225.1 hypothetical protein A6B34_02390 [Mycolicibacterium monacense]